MLRLIGWAQTYKQPSIHLEKREQYLESISVSVYGQPFNKFIQSNESWQSIRILRSDAGEEILEHIYIYIH